MPDELIKKGPAFIKDGEICYHSAAVINKIWFYCQPQIKIVSEKKNDAANFPAAISA
jgi:hypothetical protein